MGGLAKVVRYVQIYGPGRTWFKVIGRTRARLGWLRHRRSHQGADVGVIGCGQFAFSTVGYALTRCFGNRFADCYDVDVAAHRSFSEFYRIERPAASADALVANERVRYVYVTSNHASHADYAIQALGAGKTVYVEKPIAVTWKQLARLLLAVERSGQPVFAGYNRPFSQGILDLRTHVAAERGPLTLNCFVSGHRIPPEHWYRNPAEGTRICGNVGHWLDLAVHVLSLRGLPDEWEIVMAYSSSSARDDDIAISLTSCNGDLVVIVLTARCEPFEGINETINLQAGELIAKIDDFRSMTMWRGKHRVRKRYWPKDVGHKVALRQPFDREVARDWGEVVNSTLLMLRIADMVRSGEDRSSFSFSESLAEVQKLQEL